MNLLPDRPAVTPSYCCTWNVQNFGRPDAAAETDPNVFAGQDGAKKARAFLNEQNLFGPGGLCDQYAKVRSHLFFLLDDGWDVPYGVHPDTQIERFGSLALSTERFPSCTGTPAERLRKIGDRLRAAGWRGLGLWVAAQAAGETYETGFLNEQQSDAYWTERLRWSAEAGVGYWKIDWGCRQFDPAWHRRVTALRDQYAPGLWIEHAHPAAAPLNHVVFEHGVQVSDGRFGSWTPWPERWGDILRDADVFRSYDVLAQFSQVSTLDRLAELMRRERAAHCILNCEDEAYLGAALGCALGVMRSGLCRPIPVFDFDPQGVSRRLCEIDRAVNWQRLAPAFALRETRSVYASRTLVTDPYTFREGETWMLGYLHRTVSQSCPAVVTRDLALRDIDCREADRPLLAGSLHPNGAVAVAAVPHRCGGVYRTPAVSLTVPVSAPQAPVGLFGRFAEVTLAFDRPVDGLRVCAQDLAGDTAADVTARVRVTGNTVVVSGALLDRLSLDGQPADDQSAPGVLLRLLP